MLQLEPEGFRCAGQAEEFLLPWLIASLWGGNLRRYGSKLASLFSTALMATVFDPVWAAAQTASQITPRTFQSHSARLGGFSIPEGSGLTAPARAEKMMLTLSGLEIKGGLPEFGAKEAALEVKLTGHEISGADLFAAARDLEAAYAAAGYLLVRVLLPPQNLIKGSRLKLTVIDGFIERVETKDVPDRVRDRITTLIEKLVGKRGLKLSEIERQVLLASDTPGVLLRSTLAPGTEPGGSLLVIEAKHQPFIGSLNADNSLSQALGRTAPAIGADLNSVAGSGEQIYLRAGGVANLSGDGLFARYPLNRSLVVGVSLPLGLDGLSLTAEYTDARTTPSSASGMRTMDTFNRFAL
jgi:hemolysin activation/secretion protein